MIAWIGLILFIILMLALGTLAMRRTVTREEFFTGGWRLNPYLFACSLAAASASGWAYIGGPGVGYSYGVVELLSTPIAWIPGIFLVVYFAVPYYKKWIAKYQATSIGDLMGYLHGDSNVLRALVAALIFIMYMMFITAQFKAAGAILSMMLGIPTLFAILVFMVITIIYVTQGGLRAVMYTDVASIIWMIATCFLSIYIIFAAVGGFGPLFERAAAIDPELVYPTSGVPYASTIPWTFVAITIAYTAFQFAPSFSQKYISVAEMPPTRRATVATIVSLLTLMTAFPVLVGLTARVVMPGLSDPDTALPEMFNRYLPEALMVFGALGIVNAIISSVDSYLIASCANFESALKPVWEKYKVSDRTRFWTARALVLLLSLCSFIWVITKPPQLLVYLALIGSTGLAAVLTGPLFLRLFWKEGGTRNGAVISIIVTYVIYIYLEYIYIFNWIENAVIGMALSVLLYVGISKLEKAVPR